MANIHGGDYFDLSLLSTSAGTSVFVLTKGMNVTVKSATPVV